MVGESLIIPTIHTMEITIAGDIMIITTRVITDIITERPIEPRITLVQEGTAGIITAV
jgi:hypothetical protein